MINNFSLIILLFAIRFSALGSDSLKMVMYSPDFRFEDGIFLNFEMVKHNSPVPKAGILSKADFNDRDFFEKVTEAKEFSFFDGNGLKRTIKVQNIWGYANNGVLYINYNKNFNRMILIGNVSYFVANISNYGNYYSDPYYYNNPYGYSQYNMRYSPSSQQSELRQFLLRWDTGEVYDFDVNSVDVILANDPELYDEYQQLRNRKRKQLKFYYIRKYNERNPLYLPQN